MAAWLVLALIALAVWSVQRAISKAALATMSTPQLYTLTAVVSLPIYLPVIAFDPPPLSAFPPALGLSVMIAVTFGVTTEAIRRGPVGRVSPITGLSPALTVVLAGTVLNEQLTVSGGLGVAAAVLAILFLGYHPQSERGERSWLWLAIASLILQGSGAFLAKVVVTPSGPSALLVTSAAVQVVVGFVLLRRTHSSLPDLRPRLMRWTLFVIVLAALATIGYLWALSIGPAIVIVPLVATGPALGGLIGAVALHEQLGRRQYVGIGFGLLGAVLLALRG